MKIPPSTLLSEQHNDGQHRPSGSCYLSAVTVNDERIAEAVAENGIGIANRAVIQSSSPGYSLLALTMLTSSSRSH